MNINILGEQIARYRKALGMTQEDLGRAVGISAQAVSRWECGGAPDVTLLPAVADALGVTTDGRAASGWISGTRPAAGSSPCPRTSGSTSCAAWCGPPWVRP